jgi:ABC-2 type transport system permease protein
MVPWQTILIVARAEWLHLRRDGRFQTASILYALMLAFAAAFAWMHHTQVEAERLDAQTSERERWLEQGEKHPHAAAHYGFYIFRPLHPLSWLESGTTPYLGTAIFLEAHRKNEVVFRPIDDGTGMERFGVFNLATVLAVLLPLLIILVFHDRLSTEREQQTLPLLICQGLTPGGLFFGKLAAGCLVLALWLAAAAGVAATVILVSGVSLLHWDTLARLAMLILTYGGLGALFLSATLAASAWARSSFNAVGLLLGFWMIGFLIAPRVLNDHAARTLPLPTRFAFELAMQEDLNDRTALREVLTAETSRLLELHGVDDIADLPVNFRAINLQLGEEHSNAVFDRHYNALFDRMDAQNNFIQRQALAVPLLAARAVGMSMAGTDFNHHRSFIESAETYRRLMQRILNDDLLLNPETAEAPYLAGRALWEQVPPWEFENPPFRELRGGLGWPLATLVLWNLCLPLAGWFGVRRLFLNP